MALRSNQKWSVDFVVKSLPDGRWIQILTVMDQFTHECVTLLADNKLSGEKVAVALDKELLHRGAPETISVVGLVCGSGQSRGNYSIIS